uniref:Uncharacterized protein n=1 Tax=Meloidogyne hapla TaxID=6305 RepID=A0A1I8B9D8_MELHA
MSSFDDVRVSSNHVGNSKRRCASSFEPEEQEEEFTPSSSKLQRRQPCYAPYRKTHQNTTTNKITAEMGLMHGFLTSKSPIKIINLRFQRRLSLCANNFA